MALPRTEAEMARIIAALSGNVSMLNTVYSRPSDFFHFNTAPPPRKRDTFQGVTIDGECVDVTTDTQRTGRT